eukprot:4724333-Ditylum_brightwellii.AAC.1
MRKFNIDLICLLKPIDSPIDQPVDVEGSVTQLIEFGLFRIKVVLPCRAWGGGCPGSKRRLSKAAFEEESDNAQDIICVPALFVISTRVNILKYRRTSLSFASVSEDGFSSSKQSMRN